MAAVCYNNFKYYKKEFTENSGDGEHVLTICYDYAQCQHCNALLLITSCLTHYAGAGAWLVVKVG